MWGWEYVPVATRLSRARSKMDKLKKKGKVIEPVEIQGRTIVKKFWGKKWCEHLETFSDFSNRLPRGRTYVRNGSICHLSIKKGGVEAFVSGSSLYEVKITISTLEERRWQRIKNTCSGQIGSLLELLKGTLSDHVMEVVADHREGLFPNTGDIQFSCNCPDWADMCKHIAAVLYGIGNRLDQQPDLLFLLRGVDASELVATKLTTISEKTDDLLLDEGLSDLFGIDLDNKAKHQQPKHKKKRTINPAKITGEQLEEIRRGMELTVREFAEVLEVTPASIYRWEKARGTLNLHISSIRAIAQVLEKGS